LFVIHVELKLVISKKNCRIEIGDHLNCKDFNF